MVAVATMSINLNAKSNESLVNDAWQAFVSQSTKFANKGPLWNKWRAISMDTEIFIPIKNVGFFKSWEIHSPIYIQVNREVDGKQTANMGNRDCLTITHMGKTYKSCKDPETFSRYGKPCFIKLDDKPEDYATICEQGWARLDSIEKELKNEIKDNDDRNLLYIDSYFRQKFNGDDSIKFIHYRGSWEFTKQDFLLNIFEDAKLSDEVVKLKEKTKELTEEFRQKHIKENAEKAKKDLLKDLE